MDYRTVRTYIDNTNTKVDKPWITEDCKNYIDNTNTKVDKPWITEDCKNLYRQYKH